MISPATAESLRRNRRWTRWVGQNWARFSYARHIEPTWLEITRHVVTIPDLPSAYHGFRIVHLTDFHGGRSVPLPYLNQVVAMANCLSPDAVALTGDFIHKGFHHVERVAKVLGKLKARHGVFAVLGNHDFSVRNALGVRRHPLLHTAVASSLERQGIHLLRNRSHGLLDQGLPLHLVGVDDLWSRCCDVETAFSDVPPDIPCILLAHNPKTIDQINGRRCDLILSGHTHGGQINLPKLGRVLLSRHGRRYAAGWYRLGNSNLYVNRGVGYGVRFRYGVRPEVAVFQLQRG